MVKRLPETFSVRMIVALVAGFVWLPAVVVAAPGDSSSVPSIRDPFWPVGYVPKVASAGVSVAEEEQEEPEADPLEFSNLTAEEQALIKAHMKVGGILHVGGKKCIAIINEKVVREGDTLPMRIEGLTYRFLIKTLTSNRIRLEPVELDEPPKDSSKKKPE